MVVEQNGTKFAIPLDLSLPIGTDCFLAVVLSTDPNGVLVVHPVGSVNMAMDNIQALKPCSVGDLVHVHLQYGQRYALPEKCSCGEGGSISTPTHTPTPVNPFTLFPTMPSGWVPIQGIHVVNPSGWSNWDSIGATSPSRQPVNGDEHLGNVHFYQDDLTHLDIAFSLGLVTNPNITYPNIGRLIYVVQSWSVYDPNFTFRIDWSSPIATFTLTDNDSSLASVPSGYFMTFPITVTALALNYEVFGQAVPLAKSFSFNIIVHKSGATPTPTHSPSGTSTPVFPTFHTSPPPASSSS